MAETKKVKKSLDKTVKSEGQKEKPGKGLKDKIRNLSEKGLDALKKSSEKIAHFTSSGTKLAKIKLDIHNLENECNKLNCAVGKRLWQKQKENKLEDIAALFANDFKTMNSLRNKISALQEQADKISLVE